MQDSHPKNRLLPSKLADNTGLLDSEKNAGFSGLKTAERLRWLFVFVNFHNQSACKLDLT